MELAKMNVWHTALITFYLCSYFVLCKSYLYNIVLMFVLRTS